MDLERKIFDGGEDFMEIWRIWFLRDLEGFLGMDWADEENGLDWEREYCFGDLMIDLGQVWFGFVIEMIFLMVNTRIQKGI